MKQSRSTSLIKSCISTAVGFGVAFVANMVILPYFGLEISHSANLLLTTIYTVISIARGYALERVFEAMGWRTRMSAFAMAVLAERQRQVNVEGFDAHHDDGLPSGVLARAGACYAQNMGADNFPPKEWPWGADWWKPYGFRRDLVKACALIIAEGERFDRQRNPSRDDANESRNERRG